MPPQTRYADSNGRQVAYQVLGPDEPVDGGWDIVYMTGIGSHVEVRWESPTATRFLERLGGLGRLISFDKLGSGLSDPLPDSGVPGWEQWMADLHAVLDASSSREAVLVAAIDGGPTGMMFAATYPERTRALVLANTSARPMIDDDYPFGVTPEFVPGVVDFVGRAWGSDEFTDQMAPMIAASERAWFGKLQRASTTPRGAAERMRIDLASDVRSVLPLIKVPTLVIHSTRWPLLTIHHGRYLAEHIAMARLIETDSMDAALTFSGAEEAPSVIESFLIGAPRMVATDRVLATIVFTDLVGSTERAAALGDRRW